MITSLQKDQISNFLDGRNLPLDLKIEISDHIYEQLDFKIERESKDFYQAFIEIKSEWISDLVMKRCFVICGKSITKIHNETLKKSDSEIKKKSLLYFSIYFVLTTCLIFIDKPTASNFIVSFYWILISISIIIGITNFKIIRSTFSKKSNVNASFLQHTSSIFTMSCLYILVFILYHFDERFEKYYSALMKIVINSSFNMEILMLIIIFNFCAFAWIYGFIYFLEYKKALKLLEQKINFKL